jgi:pyruvate/2-oxoglutarate dehydrogenase complex dihydrolipoamide acyltransferase (E2) component
VDRSAALAGANPCLAQHGHPLLFPKRRFQRAQLGVDLAQLAQLGEHQRIVSLPEAVQAEDEPSQIAIGKLARLAQETHAPAHATARTKAGGCRCLAGIDDVLCTQLRRCGRGR